MNSEHVPPYDHWAIWRPHVGAPYQLVRCNALGYAMPWPVVLYKLVPPARFTSYYADRDEAERRAAARALSDP